MQKKKFKKASQSWFFFFCLVQSMMLALDVMASWVTSPCQKKTYMFMSIISLQKHFTFLWSTIPLTIFFQTQLNFWSHYHGPPTRTIKRWCCLCVTIRWQIWILVYLNREDEHEAAEPAVQHPVVQESAGKLIETGINTLQQTLLLKKQVEVDRVSVGTRLLLKTAVIGGPSCMSKILSIYWCVTTGMTGCIMNILNILNYAYVDSS